MQVPIHVFNNNFFDHCINFNIQTYRFLDNILKCIIYHYIIMYSS